MPGIEYLRRAPKVELHVHLEGALRAERLFRILRRHGRRPEITRPEDLAFLYRHADFRQFLDHFVGETPWAHLDIAGTMQSDADDAWRSKGATGYGARILAELARGFAPIK